MSAFAFLSSLIISSYHIIDVLSCDPLIFYPAVSNLQRLSSSEDEILLTIQESENGDSFCILFDLNDNSFGENPVECTSYSSDILSFTSEQDTTSTTINSIDETLGISITRNSEIINIEWDQLKNISNITASTYTLSEIESFTMNDPYITFLKISNELFAIVFNSDINNEYIIYSAYSSIDFNLLTAKSYLNYNLLTFIDETDNCLRNGLYIYDIIYNINNNEYCLNLTFIENGWNINVDERNGFAYLWGYSSTFRTYDVEYDALYVNRYGATDYSDIIHADDTSKALIFSYDINYILVMMILYLFNLQ